MPNKLTYIIIGFSAAGANAAESLRQLDPAAQITVLSEDERQLYLRLDLEGILRGKTAADLSPRPADYWQEKCVDIVTVPAVQIDPRRKIVVAAAGQQLNYDRLLITSGAAPRRLGIPGAHRSGIVTYHTLDDAEKIHSMRHQVKRAVIIGGGILGLELARAVLEYGWEVTLLIRGGYPGSPIVDASGSPLIAGSLEQAGVQVIYHDEAIAFDGENGRLRNVRTRQGRRIPADFAAECIGVEPAVDFLRNSGLLTGNQLIVDSRLQTHNPDVFAAGDVALVRRDRDRLTACRTWAVAQAQARVAAANMTGQNQEWREGVTYNPDYLFGHEFAMIGAWEERHATGRIIHEYSGEDYYRAVVTRQGIIESALLLGSRTGDRLIRTLIGKQAHVESKITRLFEPDARLENYL